jgi:hypothetical protein
VSIDVIVKLAQSARASDSSARRAIDACVADFGVTVEPLHPSTDDPELGSYLIAHVNADALDEVVARLRRCADVEGAYAKPPGEPPGRM